MPNAYTNVKTAFEWFSGLSRQGEREVCARHLHIANAVSRPGRSFAAVDVLVDEYSPPSASPPLRRLPPTWAVAALAAAAAAGALLGLASCLLLRPSCRERRDDAPSVASAPSNPPTVSAVVADTADTPEFASQAKNSFLEKVTLIDEEDLISGPTYVIRIRNQIFFFHLLLTVLVIKFHLSHKKRDEQDSFICNGS
ncbi:hypothetical protein ABEB36_001255 [Hypothenemus hampei]|uniref:Uncharacterized protein n=1 Tax=Hypothenemus hampei TaxID=57062 RepID=A0ABD1FH82_HYPHA